MKKLFLFLFLGMFLISLVNAVCQTNNEFIKDQNATLCLGAGYFENSSGLYPFDGTETCKIYVYYPNTTILAYDQPMYFDSVYKFNVGNVTEQGKYNVFTYCSKTNGWWDDYWNFNVRYENCTANQVRLENGSCSNITNYPKLKGAIATGTTYKQGEIIKTLTACLDENNQPTTSTANVTIYYPNNTIWINNVNMSQVELGVFNYSNYAPSTKGIYLLKSVCYSGSDNATAISEIQVPEWISGTMEYVKPILILVSPLNGSSKTDSSLVTFNLTTDETSTCTFNINSTSYPINTSSTQHSTTLAINNGYYSYNWTCEDTSGNTNSTGLYYFTLNHVISSGSGSGSSIRLYSLGLDYEDFVKGEENLIYINTTDSSGNLIDILSLDISILEDINYSVTTERLEEGQYLARIEIGESNLTELNIKVVADDYGHYETEDILVSLKDKSYFSVITGNFALSFSGASIWIENNKPTFFIILALIIVAILIISYISYYKKS